MTVYLFEQILQFAGAHEYFLCQGFQRREAFEAAAEDLLDVLHTFQVVLLHRAGQCCLFLAKEGVEEFLDKVDDAGEPADGHEYVVLFEFEQFLEHCPMGKVDEERLVVDAVLPGEYRQFGKEFLGEILHGEFMGTKDEQSSYGAAGGHANEGAVAGIGKEDVVTEGALIANDLLAMTDQDLLLYFDEVEGDHEARIAAFAMEFQVAVQFEVHDSVREVRIDVVGLNSSRAKISGDGECALVDRRVETGGEASQPFFKIPQIERVHYHNSPVFDTFTQLQLDMRSSIFSQWQ